MMITTTTANDLISTQTNTYSTGGGFGPVVCGGQIVSGIDPRTAIAITSIAEAVVSLGGTISGVMAEGWFEWNLGAPMIVGSILSVLPAVWITKHIKLEDLDILVAVLCLGFGCLDLIKVTLRRKG